MEQYRIEGVISIAQKYCDPYLFDVPFFEETLGNKGIPVLLLEIDETSMAIPGFKTRLETFVQMIKEGR